MKVADIKVGCFYHDGKSAVREVISIRPDDAGIERVEYRILAAKVMQEYSYAEKKMVSVVGGVSSCHLTSFSTWAKVCLSKSECDDLLALLAAKRIKLSPVEAAFMASVAKEFSDSDFPVSGTEISFSVDDVRPAKNIAKKGLAVDLVIKLNEGGVFNLTDVGAAWIRNHCWLISNTPGR